MDKKQMTEEDVKLQFITPAILEKWDKSRIRMEAKITDGRMNIKGNLAVRSAPKKADYLLLAESGRPIAVVEAKDNRHSVSFGMQQAKEYAAMMDVKFAYSSNGDAFQEYDFLTGVERQIPLSAFPTEASLMARLAAGSGWNETERLLMKQPCYVSQTTYAPRYYQQVAIDRTLDAIAKGQRRVLLVMVTGTGKTYTAFQIVYRLLKAGLKKKILYLADRNILVDQSITQDFKPLSKVIHKVNFAKDDRTAIKSYQVYFALYQQMVGEDDVPHFRALFSPDFFDLVIVDECHRGSAKEESRWRAVLDYFRGATQVGMTATPKETKYTSNIDYFGAPVYAYSLRQGIDDGFLAPFRVVNIHTNIGDGWRPFKGQRDYFGNEIEDRIYSNSDYDYGIVMADRIREVAEQITAYLRATDPFAKTIVFCANEDAAERMREALAGANADRMKENPDYVVRITGGDEYGKSKLDYFISVNERYPVIATTSELLSTGVDCKMTKVIALDKNISSMTMFKQIVGRGTRLREKEGKTSFAILDFRGVTRLFADPDWDGPIEVDPDFPKKPKPTSEPPDAPPGDGPDEPEGPVGPQPPKNIPFVVREGCAVYVTHKTVSVYDANGKLLRQESITDYTKRNVREQFATLDHFIRKWSAEEKKKAIADALKAQGIDLDKLKADMNMTDVDDFDLICHIAYDQKPLTRRERAENVKKRDFLHRYSGAAREVLEILLEKYKNLGIREVEETAILKLDEFQKFGTPSAIAKHFGGAEGFRAALKSLEAEIYKEA